jgi:hypothetical protein
VRALLDTQPAAPSLTTRLASRLLARKLDRMLATGTPVPPGSALHVHAQRITTIAEREAVARTFRRCVRDARDGVALFSSRLELDSRNILAAEDLIDTVTLLMHSPRPVDARGMARLRLLLTDGIGPLYRYGHGDLAVRLHGALAAMAAT